MRARKEQCRRHQLQNRDELNARARARLRKLPKKKKAQLLEYKRLYRKANPDKVRAQKQRYIAKKTPAYVEYHRRYNARPKRAQRKREQATAAYYRDHPDRPAPVCEKCELPIAWKPLPRGRAGRPPKICDACCAPSILKRRQAARAIAVGRAEVLRAKAAVEPLKVQTPMPVPYARTGQRLCLTPGCRTVVTHRKKVCTKCKQRAVEAAKAALANRRGRGRRTDLEQRQAA